MLVINGKVKTVYVSNRNLNSPDHINNQPLAVREAVEKECQKMGHGITLQSLIDDDKGAIRPLFNLISMNEWKMNFEYIGNEEFKEQLW